MTILSDPSNRCNEITPIHVGIFPIKAAEPQQFRVELWPSPDGGQIAKCYLELLGASPAVIRGSLECPATTLPQFVTAFCVTNAIAMGGRARALSLLGMRPNEGPPEQLRTVEHASGSNTLNGGDQVGFVRTGHLAALLKRSKQWARERMKRLGADYFVWDDVQRRYVIGRPGEGKRGHWRLSRDTYENLREIQERSERLYGGAR